MDSDRTASVPAGRAPPGAPELPPRRAAVRTEAWCEPLTVSTTLAPFGAIQDGVGVLLAVVAQSHRLALEDGLDVDGASPNLVDVFQRLLGVGQIELLPFVVVTHQQLGVAIVVSVVNRDVGRAKVGHAG